MGNVTATEKNIDKCVAYTHNEPWWVNGLEISEELLDKHIDKPWNFDYLSEWFGKNKWSGGLLSKHIHKPWNFDRLSDLNISEEFLERHTDKPWKWSKLQKRVSYRFVTKHPDLAWDWKNMIPTCYGETLPSEDFIDKHSHKNFDWDNISYFCHHLSVEFIQKHKDKLNLEHKNIVTIIQKETKKQELIKQLDLLLTAKPIVVANTNAVPSAPEIEGESTV